MTSASVTGVETTAIEAPARSKRGAVDASAAH